MIDLQKFLSENSIIDIFYINKIDKVQRDKIEEAFILYGKYILEGLQHSIEGLNTLEEVEAVIERVKTQLI